MKKSARITVPVNARPKQFLRYMTAKYGCELEIDDEEHFSSGFLNLTKMVTIWFTITGSNAIFCFAKINSSFENWKKVMLNDDVAD